MLPQSKKDFNILKEFNDGIYEISINTIDTRTLSQNRAYWLWAKMIAETLNNAGLYIPKVIKLDTEWNKDKVNELIFKPTLKALFKKSSSTQLRKNEYDNIIDTITKAFGTKGIIIPSFPDKNYK